jgi:hypothetical protein
LIKPNPKIFLALQRHGVLPFKERPAVAAWNCLIFDRSAFSVKVFCAIAKNGDAKAKDGETTGGRDCSNDL